MKRIQSLIVLTFALFSFIANAQNNKKEVLIIGTMHQVPKYLKNSYKPLYKLALKYNPGAIYIEVSRAADTLSMQNHFPKFLEYSDSLKTVFECDEVKFNALIHSDLETLKKEDFKYLAKSYATKRDYANHKYYAYLFNYGTTFPKKPFRNEDGDLSYKLAAKLGMKHIYSMDDQKDNPAYHKAWRACVKAGMKNGDDLIAKKISKKIFRSAIIPSIFGKNGKWTNNIKTMTRFHISNSFRYTTNDCEPCKEGMKYWDQRNRSMAINIGEQINENTNQKNLVVVGAGHVVGLKQELEILYPNIIVKIIQDKPLKNSQNHTDDESLISER